MSGMKRDLSCALVAALLALAGCHDKKSPEAQEISTKTSEKNEVAPSAAPEPSEAPATQTGSKRVEVREAPPPEITLLEPGAEPFETLVLDPPDGLIEAFEMAMEMSIGMKLGDQRMPPMTPPTMVVGIQVELKDKTDDALHLSQRVLDTGLREISESAAPMAEAMREAMKGMEKFSADVELSRTGALRKASIVIADDLPPQVQQTVDQMIDNFGRLQVPLPNEPVGVGARWTAKTNMELNGMSLEQVMTYRLDGREGTRLDLSVDIVQSLASQTVAPPGMPPGSKVDIQRFVSKGSGNMKMDLAHLLPIEGRTNVELDMAMAVEAAGQKQEMEMTMTMDVSLTGRP